MQELALKGASGHQEEWGSWPTPRPQQLTFEPSGNESPITAGTLPEDWDDAEGSRFTVTKSYDRFQVGVTWDLYSASEDAEEATKPHWNIPGINTELLHRLAPHIAIHPIKKADGADGVGMPPLLAKQLKLRDTIPLNAVITMGPAVIASTLLDPADMDSEGATDGDQPDHDLGIDGSLLAICNYGATYANIDVNACTESSVLVITTMGAGSVSIAEGILTLILGTLKKLMQKEQSADWQTALDPVAADLAWRQRLNIGGSNLKGKSVGLIGFDDVAKEVVIRLCAFGISKVFVYMPGESFQTAGKGGTLTEKVEEGNQAFAEAKATLPKGFHMEAVVIKDLLRVSDIVSVHCTANDRGCFGLLDLDMLALMQPTSILINAAFGGGVVDEEALFVALHDHAVAAAGIDTFSRQPPLAETMERFAKLDNCVMTRGNISSGPELQLEMANTLWEALSQIACGEIPSKAQIVNPEVVSHSKFNEKWKIVMGCLPESCRNRVQSEAAGGLGQSPSTPQQVVALQGIKSNSTPKSTPRRVGASRSNTPRISDGAGI